MKNPPTKFHRHLLLLLFLLIAAGKFQFKLLAEASQRKIHIPDELDDVVDDEEDDDWREWGKTKKQPELDPPPPDFTKMGLHEMQGREIMGPVFGFVKLRPGTLRTPVMSISSKFSLLNSALLFIFMLILCIWCLVSGNLVLFFFVLFWVAKGCFIATKAQSHQHNLVILEARHLCVCVRERERCDHVLLAGKFFS